MTTEEKALQDIRGAIRRGQKILTLEQIVDTVEQELGPGTFAQILQEQEEG
jgi:hypothetical protein